MRFCQLFGGRTGATWESGEQVTNSELDPRLTFESFVVGPANRLASAAARRAADSPGTSYNPLFLYSDTGLGKTHVLVAIAHRAKKINPDLRISYLAMDRFLEQLAHAQGTGNESAILDRLKDTDVLLVDDVHHLSGKPDAQEILLHTLDTLSESGGQIVLASDRPPSEIESLDGRIVSRFSGGLIVDIASPEYETRVAIVRKKIAERGGELADGVAELLARFPIRSVRELGGVINRLLAIQELEGRRVSPEEVPTLVASLNLSEGDEFGSFVDEIAQDVATTVEFSESPWHRELRECVGSAEGEGFNSGRLRRFLEQEASAHDARRVVEQFRSDCDRLKAIRTELNELGNPWPEAALGVLRDPDRMEEAESLLASARELTMSFPEAPAGPPLEELLEVFPEATVAAVGKILEPDGGNYSPLYLWSPAGVGSKALLTGLARSFRSRSSKGRVAFVSVQEFSEDFIRALSAGVAGAWRERWWRAELLLIHRVQDLASAERAQDELFHLFEAIQRNGGRIAFCGDRPPSRLQNVDPRIMSRLEGGSVVQADTDDLPIPQGLETGDFLSADAASAAGGAGDPSTFDTVLGANVLEADQIVDLDDFLTPPTNGTDRPAAAASSDLLDVDFSSIDEFDVLNLDGADPAALPEAPVAPPAMRAAGRHAPASATQSVPVVASPEIATEGASATETPETTTAAPLAQKPQKSKRSLPAGWVPSNEEVVWNWPAVRELMVWEGAE